MTPPHLSLLMVNYNRASYIETAINSVLTQTYPDWELIIVDDGSTDDSVAKIKPFLRDARIRFFANAEKILDSTTYFFVQRTSRARSYSA